MVRHELSFLEFLQQFRRGELIRQADAELERVIGAMAQTGGSGEITIKLPFKLNKAGQVECQPKLTAKIPQPEMGTGIYFVGEEGRLSRRDPNQYDIEDEIERRRAGGDDG